MVLLTRCAVVLFGILVALVLAELGLRLGAGLITRSLPIGYDRRSIDAMMTGKSWVVFDQELGWVNTPGYTYTDGTLRYANNEKGMRADREYRREPRDKVARYAAYGDSFTYCWSVNYRDCWTSLLERRLPDTEVLNFGVPGYGPDQAWLRYQRDGPSWHPCAVVIGHMLENIHRVVNRFRPFLEGHRNPLALAKPRFLLKDGKLVLLPNPVQNGAQLKDPAWVEENLGPSDDWYFPNIYTPSPLDQSRLLNLMRTGAFAISRREALGWAPAYVKRAYQPGREGFEIVASVLTGFAADVRAQGATPVVLIFPTGNDIVSFRDGANKSHQALLDRLAQAGIPTVDLTDALADDARSSPLPDLGLAHYRERENEVVAATLADVLPALTKPTCG